MIRPVLLMLLPFGIAAAAAADPLPSIDACALITPAEIQSVIGHAVNAGARRDSGLEADGAWSSSCVWTLTEEAVAAQGNVAAPLRGRSFVILNAVQWPLGSGRAREFLDAFHQAAASGVLRQAPSPRKIGDEALWWGDGLAVRKNDVSFGLSVQLRRSKPSFAGVWEEALAPRVLAQIERRDAGLSRTTGF
jgi:hypothetical protein